MDPYDVIVIGAGIQGSATAYHLAGNNQRTLLLEQFTLPHIRGSSHGHSRITRRAYSEKHFAVMMSEAFEVWDSIAQEAGVELYKQVGLLSVIQNDKLQYRALEGALRDCQIVYSAPTTSQAQETFPMFNFPDESDILHTQEAGILKADVCLSAMQRLYVKRGGEIQDGQQVVDIVPGDTVVIRTARGDTFRARSIVITSGPWASQLLAPIGLHLPLQPVKIEVCYWKLHSPELYTASRGHPCVIWTAPNEHIYGMPSMEYHGMVKLCSHVGTPIHPDARDKVNGKDVINGVADFVRKNVPALHDRPSIVESCIYTMTPDETPILDTHPTWKNIVFGAGFSGTGFKIAPVVGKLLAELATGHEPSYDMTPFKMDRFFPIVNQSKL